MHIDFLSLNKLRFWLFLMLETFVAFLKYIFYMFFHNIIDKFNSESIVIPSSVQQMGLILWLYYRFAMYVNLRFRGE